MIFGESVQNRMFLIIVEGGWGFPSVSCDLIYFVLITSVLAFNEEMKIFLNMHLNFKRFLLCFCLQ